MKLGFSFLKLVASLGWEVAVSVGSEPFGEGRGYWWTGIDRLRFWESTRRVVSDRVVSEQWEAFDAQYATLDKWGQWTYIRRLSRVLSTKSTTNGPSVIYGMWGALPVQVWLRLNQEHHSFNQITARYAFFITSSFILSFSRNSPKRGSYLLPEASELIPVRNPIPLTALSIKDPKRAFFHKLFLFFIYINPPRPVTMPVPLLAFFLLEIHVHKPLDC